MGEPSKPVNATENLLARTWTLVALAAVLVVLALLFLRMVYPYLLPTFLAAVLAVVLRPQYSQLARWLRGRERLAAAITLVLSVVAVVVPLVLATVIVALRLYVFWLETQAAGSGAAVIGRTAQTLGLEGWLQRIEQHTGRDLESIWEDVQANIPEVVNWLAGRTLGVATATFGVLGGIASIVVAFFVFLFALYYFLAEGPGLLERASQLIPLPVEYQVRMFDAFTSTVRGAIVAMFVAALLQGTALGLVLWLVGVPKPFLMTVLSILSGFVPFVGTGLVWLPASVWLWATGAPARAIALLVFGAVFVAGMDNLIRAYLLKDTARLHPLLALISILGGIAYFGLWGIFIGPIVASCLYATADVLKDELVELGGTEVTGAVAGSSAGETKAPQTQARHDKEKAKSDHQNAPSRPKSEGDAGSVRS